MISRFQYKESLNRQEPKQRAQTIGGCPVGFFVCENLYLKTGHMKCFWKINRGKSKNKF